MDSIMELYVGFATWWNDRRGQDIVEYVLIAGFIALAAVAFIMITSTSMQQFWIKLSDVIDSVAGRIT